MNYIKGFRYQLYCEAKALGTPSCVVCIPYILWSVWNSKTRGGESGNLSRTWGRRERGKLID